MKNKFSSSMFHWYYFGPFFGYGIDLHILSHANNNIKSHYNPGNNYVIPPGKTNTFLAGSNNFKVSEIEIFQII